MAIPVENVTLCGGGNKVVTLEWALEPIGSYWTYAFPMVPDTLCFQTYGWTFFVIGLVSILVATACAAAVYLLREEAWHRSMLYVFFGVSMAVRGVFCLLSFQKLKEVKVHADLLEQSQFFLHALLPVNAVADLVSAWVDVLLTWFWAQALSEFPSKTVKPILAVMAASSVALAGCIIYDSSQVDTLKAEAKHSTAKGMALWRATLVMIGVIMTSTALLHAWAALLLVYRAVKHNLLQHAGIKHQLHKVIAIASVTITCCVSRGLVIVLRFGVPMFQSGALSFNDPAWTSVYYLLLVIFPTVVVGAAYSRIVVDRLRERLSGYADYQEFGDHDVETSAHYFVPDD